MDAVLAVESGGTKLQMAVVSPAGKVLLNKRQVIRRDAGSKGILESIFALWTEVSSFVQEEDIHLLAAGWGFGGPVNISEGTVI